MNIIFFGSSDYSLPVLDSLLFNFNLVAVVTKPDQNIGRKQIITPTAVKFFAQKNHLPCFTPADKATLSIFENKLADLAPDIFIVADYGLIIPKIIIDLPKYKTINIHFSKLPFLRGPSPVQFSILNGEKSGWISYMLMDEKMDTGMILSQTEEKLTGEETTGSLYRKLFDKASRELPDIITGYVKKELKPQIQDHTKATYTKLLKREDGYVPYDLFNKNIENDILIERKIRALTPWPGVWTTIQTTENKKQITKRLKILKAHLASRGVGLQIDMVQLEGKNPVSWKQFTEGYQSKLSG